jgi:hypothetical protein
MTMKALDYLLGRSTYDPDIRRAFDEGTFAHYLTELEFDPPLRERLLELEADSFDAFARKAYRVVLQAEHGGRPPVPWPTEGLLDRPKDQRIAA